MAPVAPLSPEIAELAQKLLFYDDFMTTRRPLDAIEVAIAADAPATEAAGADIDLSELWRRVTRGDIPASATERLLAALIFVDLPLRIEPEEVNAAHRPYPSPRTYFPLRFQLVDGTGEFGQRGASYRVDIARMRLVPLPDAEQSEPRDSPYLRIFVDFSVYATFYNLLRLGLAYCELGHFTATLSTTLSALGLMGTLNRTANGGLRYDVARTSPASGSTRATELRSLRQTFLARSAGRGRMGIYPHLEPLTLATMSVFLRAFAIGVDRLRLEVPACFGVLDRLQMRILIAGGGDFEPGTYAIASDGTSVSRIAGTPQVQDIGRLHGYPGRVAFDNVPAIFAFQWALTGLGRELDGAGTFAVQTATGYLAQHLLLAGASLDMFARPYKSFDHYAVDRCFSLQDSPFTSLYMVMVGRGRAGTLLGGVR